MRPGPCCLSVARKHAVVPLAYASRMHSLGATQLSCRCPAFCKLIGHSSFSGHNSQGRLIGHSSSCPGQACMHPSMQAGSQQLLDPTKSFHFGKPAAAMDGRHGGRAPASSLSAHAARPPAAMHRQQPPPAAHAVPAARALARPRHPCHRTTCFSGGAGAVDAAASAQAAPLRRRRRCCSTNRSSL